MLDKLFSGGLVGSVGKIVDELHTSDEEKAQAKIKLKTFPTTRGFTGTPKQVK